MNESLIHDRGRGPELIGTRITVYNLIPYFLDPTATEDYLCRLYDLTREQVAAARAYVMTNFAEVMAANARIDERLRREYEAQDTPEFRARAAAGQARLEQSRVKAGATPPPGRSCRSGSGSRGKPGPNPTPCRLSFPVGNRPTELRRRWFAPSPRVLRRDPLPRGERVGAPGPHHGRVSNRGRRGTPRRPVVARP